MNLLKDNRKKLVGGILEAIGKTLAVGLTDGLFRTSVGIENADDLLADFTQAFDLL